MREMVSRSSFSWDQAGMTQRTASNMISTWTTDFFFVINIFVVNIAEPRHVRTVKTEDYTPHLIGFCCTGWGLALVFSPGLDPSYGEGCGGCTLIFALGDMGKHGIKGQFREKGSFS